MKTVSGIPFASTREGYNAISPSASKTMNFISIFLLALSTVSLLSAPAFAQRTLRYTDHEPLGLMRTRFIKDVFFPAVEKESNGRLKIEDHWDGEVAKSYDALGVVKRGQVVDMAIVVPEYAPNNLPLHQIFKSFPIGPTGAKQVEFFRRVYRKVPAFSAELKKENVVPVFLATGYPVAFYGTKPLNTLDDLKGDTWRTASFWHQGFLKNTGATPVTMPWNEGINKAMQEKTLHGVMVNVDSGYQLKIHETAPHVLASPDLWLGHLYLLVMNKNTWNSLDKKDRQAIERAAESAYKKLGPVMDSSFATQIDDLKKAGATVRILGRPEVKRWSAAAQYKSLQADWVKEQQAKGTPNVESTLKKVGDIMRDIMK